jgi:hypothetical protein
MRLQYSLLLLGALVAAGCKDKPLPPVKTPELGEAFSQIHLPPQATLISRGGSEDALQLVFLSDLPASQVADYYRQALTSGTWNLVSDQQGQGGALVLYAEQQGGPPMWVRISDAESGVGSRVEITGAVTGRQAAADSAPAAPAPAAPRS